MDRSDTFNVFRIAAKSIAGDASIAGKIKKFEEVLEIEYLQFFKMVNGKDITKIQVIVFGVDRGEMTIYQRQFKIRRRSNGSHWVSITRKQCPPRCPTAALYFSIGKHEHADKIAFGSGFWSESIIPQQISGLIQLEMKANPLEVGGPIDILQLTKDGAEWIQKKDECPNIQPPLKNLTTKP